MTRPAHFAHLRRHLQSGFLNVGNGLAGHQLWRQMHRLLNIEGLMAPSARELLVLYCISLQYSHRTTSRVSTLTKVVAILDVRSARAGPRVRDCTTNGATFND